MRQYYEYEMDDDEYSDDDVMIMIVMTYIIDMKNG